MKKTLFLVKILISVTILYYLIRRINFKELLDIYYQIKILILLIPFLLLVCQSILSSSKWKILLSADQISVPFLFLLKSYLLGNFISLFLPSSFGGDIYRVYALKEYNPDSFKNVSSVLFDRISGLFALCSISIISYVLFYKNLINFKFLIFYLIGVVSFLLLSSDRALTLFPKFKLKLINKFLQILKSFNRYRHSKAVLIQSLAISFLFQSNIIFINKFYCIALNLDISLKYLFMVIPLIYLTEALPISINGLGVREGAFVFFLSQAGYTKEEALGLALLVITMRYFFCLIIGGSLFLKVIVFKKEVDNSVDVKNLKKSEEIIG